MPVIRPDSLSSRLFTSFSTLSLWGGLLGLWAFSPLSATAGEMAAKADSLAPDVVVTATRTPVPAQEIANALTVIHGDDLRRLQALTLVEALRTVPGLHVVQDGGLGKRTSLFMRGSNANHTLVLMDGVEINDPTSPDGAFNFGDFPVEDVERIEILRGSQGTLYGSDAVGGVINIITRQGEGPMAARARLEGGSFGTFNQAASLAGGTALYDYAMHLNRLDSDGISTTPKRRRAGLPRERDGYENLTLSSRLGFRPGENVEAGLSLRYTETESALDTSIEDPDSTGENNLFFGGAHVQVTSLDGQLENRLGVGYTRYGRKDFNQPDLFSAAFSRSRNHGEKLKFDWQGNYHFLSGQILTLGLETEKESIDITSLFSPNFTSATNQDLRSNAAFLQQQIALGGRFFATLGVRVDDHRKFGSEVTYRLAPAYLIHETRTKLKAALGTGFKAPTLFQLFGSSQIPGFTIFTGNPNLQPEKSRSWELGIEQEVNIASTPVSLGATYFDMEIKNLIVSTPAFDSVENRARADLKGVEAFLTTSLEHGLSLRLDYTFLRAEDATTHNELLRRPKHKATASLIYQAMEALQLSLEAQVVSAQADIDADLFNRRQNAGYGVVHIQGRYTVTPRLQVFGRIENLLDRDYEAPSGINQPGIAGFAGLIARY